MCFLELTVQGPEPTPPYGRLPPPPSWMMDRYSPYDRPPYDLVDRPPHMAGQPYGRMLGYDPFMHHPGYSWYAERAVFDYSDRRDAPRFGDRLLYDSAEASSRPGLSLQVVDVKTFFFVFHS